MSTKIKICGMRRVEDIEAVNFSKPDYVGFIFDPTKKRFISYDNAAILKDRLSPDITAVGVFVNGTADDIISLTADSVIDAIQLHGNEDEAFVEHIKSQTGKPVIKAVKVRSTDDITKWQHSAADFLLLDNGCGTGKPFDWTNFTAIEKPFFLAGGINEDNVEQGIKTFHPYAVDISSSVETNGCKDANKINSIIRRIRNYD